MNQHSVDSSKAERFATPLLEDAEARLSRLERQALEDLELMGHPTVPWVDTLVHSNGEHIFDVVVQGAGMQGMAIAHSLQRHFVTNILLIDENESGLEGPWLRYARMHFLRTSKLFVGPDLGLPSLSFRAWFVARHGKAAWNQAANIPKADWFEYLQWFRRFRQLPVWNGTKIELIEPVEEGRIQLFRITISRSGLKTAIFARKVVRAAGMLGAGGAKIPISLTQGVPETCYNHSSDPIDFAALKGKRIAIIGAGASAYDNAATCLEYGAHSVTIFMRRASPSIKFENLMSTMEWMKHFAELSDGDRWRLHDHMMKFSAPPPSYATRRTSGHKNFEIRSGDPVRAVSASKHGKMTVQSASSTIEFDHLIFATGFDVNLANVPELAPLYPHIALWHHRFPSNAAVSTNPMGRYPYLGGHFEYQERAIGMMPCLRNLYEFGHAATLSLGLTCVGLNSLGFGVRRLVDGITRDFFISELPSRIEKLLAIDPLDESAGDRLPGLAQLR